MCYKNFAPLGLEYKMHARLQEFRPAGARMQNTFGSTRISPHWGLNTKYMRGYKNFAPLGLECKIHLGLQEFRPAGVIMQNTCGLQEYPPAGALIKNVVLPFSSS